MAKGKKLIRQQQLVEYIKSKPFSTDEDLAHLLDVSIQTIRLDRLELGIPELRERVKQLAQDSQSKVKSIKISELSGQLIDLELGRSGISLLEISEDMVYEQSGVAKGEFLYAQANSLALAIIDSQALITGVANIKYNTPVYLGDKLIAKAQLKNIRANKFFVWVIINNGSQEVFRAKFILVSLNDEHKGAKA